MNDHHLQRDLLHKLVVTNGLRFSELRPKTVDSNVITYHLHQLTKQKLIKKEDDGLYTLTELGKVAGTTITLSKQELLEQAHSILLMVLRDGDRWLLRRRKAQPMFDMIGFVHSEPVASKNAVNKAEHDFYIRTGLSAKFNPKGFGYIKLMRGDKLESFVHFSLFEAHDYSGTFIEKTRNGENLWVKQSDFKQTDMIPSMQDFVKELEKPGMFYLDKTYQLE